MWTPALGRFLRRERMKRIFIFISILLISNAVFSLDTNLLKFRILNNDIKQDNIIPEGYEKISLYLELEKIDYIAEKEISFNEKYIKHIELNFDDFSNRPEINLCLTEDGKEIFTNLTACNIGKNLLVQIDNYALLDVLIKKRIASDSITFSGVRNLEVIQILKENFDCIDNTNLAIGESNFKKSTFSQNPKKKVNKKNPTQVIDAFLYLYKKNNSKWKKYIISNKDYEPEEIIEELEELRKGFYSFINNYEIYTYEMTESEIVPEFDDEDFFEFDIPFKLENKENIFIQNIHLAMNKKNEYFIIGIN